MHVIFQGNPVTGHTIYGVFASKSEATAWATDHLTGHWWIGDVIDKATVK